MMNYELAERDYMAGMKYKDIAAKYNVTINTVKSWKTRKWKKGVHTKSEKVCTQKKECAPPVRYAEEEIAEEVEQVAANTEITAQQQLFCLYYSKSFNATRAYMKAYGVGYAVAASNAYRTMGIDGVIQEINRLKQGKFNRAMFTEEDLFQKYMDIAYADIHDYVVIDTVSDDFGRPATRINARNDDDLVDGTLINEISGSSDGGIKIKLLDKMKAMDWLSKHMNFATPEQQQRLKLLEAQTAKMNKEIGDDKDKPIQITFRKAGDRNASDG